MGEINVQFTVLNNRVLLELCRSPIRLIAKAVKSEHCNGQGMKHYNTPF
jgi:hypothetical protein